MFSYIHYHLEPSSDFGYSNDVLSLVLNHVVVVVVVVFAFGKWLHAMLSQTTISPAQWRHLIHITGGSLLSVIAITAFVLQVTGKLQWTGRSLTLLDPTYASKYIPIIASVSEHQPTSWSAFYMGFGPALLVMPLGLFSIFDDNDNHATDPSAKNLKMQSSSKIFLVLYSSLAWYFAGIMNRLVITLAPAASIVAAIGISSCIDRVFQWIAQDQHTDFFQVEGDIGEDAEVIAHQRRRQPRHRQQPQDPLSPLLMDEDVVFECLNVLGTVLRLEKVKARRRKTPGHVQGCVGAIWVR